MKWYRTTFAGVPRRLYTAAFVVIIATLACGVEKPQPAEVPTPTSTPKIGVPVYGVTCDPAVLEMVHGETKTIAIADTGGVGRVTEFTIGTVTGTTGDSDASEINVSQQPAPNDGWSALPGQIQVVSTAVDGPERTESYLINIIVGGGRGTQNITGGNIWCQVNVKHLEPTPTPSYTATMTLTPTATSTPTKPPYIVTGSGYRVQFIGPWQAQTDGTLPASFQVIGPDNLPAQGTFYATLGDPPSDPMATHANGQLDQYGRITLVLNVNWPPGTTKLYFNFDNATYEVGEITINP